MSRNQISKRAGRARLHKASRVQRVEKLLQGSRSTIRVGKIYGGIDESNERRRTPSVGSECKEG